ncbi:carbohydrate ABC transporter permease [Natronospora cellulosivora (SeqCode)]
MKNKKFFKYNLKTRDSIAAYIFILPFILGFLLFILMPIIQSVLFSINEIQLEARGFSLNFIGMENYNFLLREDTNFLEALYNSMFLMLNNVFWILIFSFFAANLLNQKFRGRLIARVIFFLPVIISAGIIVRMEQTDYMMGVMQSSVESGGFLSGAALQQALLSLHVPPAFINFIVIAVNNIADIINASGIQILIFLAGLQAIDPFLYEAAEVEGSTKWENFWLITLPMLSPLILTNIVYTIIDFFTSPSNMVIDLIRNTTFDGRGFGTASAMSWIYFLLILFVLGVVVKLVSRFVYYDE